LGWILPGYSLDTIDNVPMADNNCEHVTCYRHICQKKTKDHFERELLVGMRNFLVRYRHLVGKN